MVGMIMCEKYAVDIVVGDSQIEELFKVSVTEINKRVDFFFLGLELQRNYGAKKVRLSLNQVLLLSPANRKI